MIWANMKTWISTTSPILKIKIVTQMGIYHQCDAEYTMSVNDKRMEIRQVLGENG